MIHVDHIYKRRFMVTYGPYNILLDDPIDKLEPKKANLRQKTFL